MGGDSVCEVGANGFDEHLGFERLTPLSHFLDRRVVGHVERALGDDRTVNSRSIRWLVPDSVDPV